MYRVGSRPDDVLLDPEVPDDEVLPLGRVLAHVELEEQVDCCGRG